MQSLQLLFFTLSVGGLRLAASVTVSVKPSGQTIKLQDAFPQTQHTHADSQVRSSLLGRVGGNTSALRMNVTIVDAREANPAMMLALQDNSNAKPVSVVTSWVLFHMPGNHTETLKSPVLPKLVGGVRDAVADALEVCRSSLGIVDMRAINIDVIDKYDDYLEEQASVDDKKDNTYGDDTYSLLGHAANLMRSMRLADKTKTHVNVTQIKAVYEVRIFKEMRYSDAEVSRRVDKFQIYSKFSDLNRLLGRSLAQVDGHSMDGVLLDDVGYATRHEVSRPPLSSGDLADCVEEVSLHDARQLHQFIVAVSLIIVALITCAGSTVFTIKHASSVPSRMNPLVSSD